MKSRVLELEGRKGLAVYRALASGVRLRIMTHLGHSPSNINALGQALGLSQSNVTRHVQALERAGLVEIEYMPGAQGTQKVCRSRYDRFLVAFEDPSAPSDDVEEFFMPIGMYSIVSPTPTCGIATADRAIGFFDDPQAFLHPERAEAQILWMAEGFVEYVFPNTLPVSAEAASLELSMEICSEAPGYDDDYPSDITLWINDVEVATWTSPGDFGGVRGRLNPSWWPDRDTQFGELKTWRVDGAGASVDGQKVQGPTLAELRIEPKRAVTVRIGVKPMARHGGGFNLFGRRFGNHEQDIVFRLHYKSGSAQVSPPPASPSERFPATETVLFENATL
jgi:predicted transcriptional regulator